jgi:hypothetical protein
MSGWDDPVGRIRELERRLSAVKAEIAQWEEWARNRSTPRIDAFRDAAERIRTALGDR